MDRFSGTRVILTGAGSGMGQATVLRLVAEGARVVAMDRNAAGLAETAGLAADPDRVATRVVDVTDEASVVAAVRAAAAELGGVDVLINLAGIHRTTPIESLTVHDLRELFEVNLVGTALMCREAVPHLPDGSGVIVNVASLSATQGNPYMSAYSASKGAVRAFSLSLAAELIGRGIRVVSVSPGHVDTPLTRTVAADDAPQLDFSYFDRIRSPMGPGTVEQLAGAIAFVASPDAAYLTGVDLLVDGGSHL